MKPLLNHYGYPIEDNLDTFDDGAFDQFLEKFAQFIIEINEHVGE